ncbi:unnamed protein product [Acanthoscelides obtectus]|uniref:Uncharacterized protein n=1 Tax=Acanthoscelides obtectus TaxID=200917 RepID=A0A9P0L9B2_ACAOB|nr:unnamed protein product [Acanthoscelides obtectus]CAK1671783.1 Ras-related protein RabJ [Acanthoscelides obtectus]
MKIIRGKVVVLGCQGVGKTSTIIRYIENTFPQQTTPTIGASFFNCSIDIDENLKVALQIWDTAGQERFKAMAPMFYRNANAALLVFDITSSKSFESMKGWVLELKRNVEERMVLFVVGNKIDLPEIREISRTEAMQYSNSIGASYYECSAMTDQGVGVIFEKLALELMKLSGEEMNHTLKVTSDAELMACSTELPPTDTAIEEIVNLSFNDSIAYGNPVPAGCCFN